MSVSAQHHPHPFVACSDYAPRASWASGDEFAILADTEATGGSFSLTDHRGVAGGSVPPHVHHSTDEAFYVLEGEYRFTVDGAELVVKAGSFVFIPRGAWHGFTVGPDGGHSLTIFSPGGYEETFSEVGAAMASGGDVPGAFARMNTKYDTESRR